jgi:6-phosphogluconolactonase
MQSAMRIEVYPTDADALDAVATLVAERTRAGGRASVALGGGRSGRAVMAALAGRGDLPWERIDWYLADERCGAPDDPRTSAKIARDTLFGPRGVAAAAVCAPAPDGGSAEDVAARWAETLAGRLGPTGRIDVVVLGLGADGALGALPPVSAALDATAWAAPVPAAGGEPARVSVTPALLDRAGHVVVVAVGPEPAAALARALRSGEGPAARVPPSDRATWIVDRDAAGELLKDATPA